MAHVAFTLADGRVVIAGGIDPYSPGTDFDPVYKSTGIYDPLTKAWLTGGYRISGMVTQRTELFDPNTGVSVEGPVLREQHIRHSAIRLTNGEVLIFGGSNGNQPMSVVEILK